MCALLSSLLYPKLFPYSLAGVMLLGRLYWLGDGVNGARSPSKRLPILGAGVDISEGRLYAAGPEYVCVNGNRI